MGSERGDQWLEFLIERVDLGGQLLAAFNQGARQAGDKPVEASESYGDRGEVFRAPQSTGWKVPGGVEFMQVPAQPVDHAGRSATRSSRWSASRRTWRLGPSRQALGKSGSRKAARATASASIGSDLP